MRNPELYHTSGVMRFYNKIKVIKNFSCELQGVVSKGIKGIEKFSMEVYITLSSCILTSAFDEHINYNFSFLRFEIVSALKCVVKFLAPTYLQYTKLFF